MIEFSTDNPFPLLSEDSHTYAEAQEHSLLVDRWLGIKAEEIEASINPIDGQQAWAGLGVSALMTPYTELRFILEKLHPASGETLVDLGAAYGRMGFVLGRDFPDVKFIGYELEAKRVTEGSAAFIRAGFSNARLLVADLSEPSFQPEKASYYFIYDYGTRQAINKTLEDLRKIASERKITVVGRGRASRDAIERGHPWLSQVTPPEHFKHFSVYRS